VGGQTLTNQVEFADQVNFEAIWSNVFDAKNKHPSVVDEKAVRVFCFHPSAAQTVTKLP